MKLVGRHHQVAQGIYPYHPYPFSRFMFVSERIEELSTSAFTVSGFDTLRKETFLHFEFCAWQTVNLHIVDPGLQQVTKKQIMIFRCSYALNVRGINYSRLRVGIRLHQVCLNWNLPMRVLHNQRSSITKLWNSEIEPKLNAVRIIAYMIRTPQVEDCSKMQSSIYESSAVRMPSGQFLAEGHCSTWTTHLRDLLVSRGTEISGDGGDPTWSMRDLEHGG